METKINLGQVLVLEDEPFIILDLEETLREFGAASVVSCNTRTGALEWLASNSPDVAIVDPRLTDGICDDVVERLAVANVPFIVYSGANVDEPAFANGRWLDKPAMPEVLRDALTELLSR
ncbi:response regulator [Rhizobium sp. YK2]|uniref:response regulator n=1 Tax=Rhizobium sp. YK2 TaxID=1860096 RepID=UPI00084CB93D|nr:response regulator [Rhizobium sp. YK2]OEC96915.1 hypothetical protein A9Z06_28340 [Rhizobium sp. YK2]